MGMVGSASTCQPRVRRRGACTCGRPSLRAPAGGGGHLQRATRPADRQVAAGYLTETASRADMHAEIMLAAGAGRALPSFPFRGDAELARLRIAPARASTPPMVGSKKDSYWAQYQNLLVRRPFAMNITQGGIITAAGSVVAQMVTESTVKAQPLIEQVRPRHPPQPRAACRRTNACRWRGRRAQRCKPERGLLTACVQLTLGPGQQ